MQVKEISYDQFTPITAYFALEGSCILESSPGKDRYSFVGIDPIEKIEGQGDYKEKLRAFRKKFPIQVDHPLALYMGALIGYVGYDKSYCFHLYRSGVIFDHQTGRAILATLGDKQELTRLYEKLISPSVLSEIELEMGEVKTDLSDAQFAEVVEKAKEHLLKGDVYQIVLSRSFRAKLKGDPFQFYRALRRLSPAPFLFFFNFETFSLAGASPEKIISVQDGVIESTPIAGTCPKGGCIKTFLSDPKEAAEHVMLVDLARNDVGSVATAGSVKVTEYKVLQEFSHVNHIVSKVEGKLAPEFDALDAFEASFPAGTLTGAPKKRAMELIADFEKSPRDLYGGGIVVLDAQGNLMSCITIRTAVIQNGEMLVRAGAGIVLDSDPIKEAEETRHKANTILGVANVINHR